MKTPAYPWKEQRAFKTKLPKEICISIIAYLFGFVKKKGNVIMETKVANLTSKKFGTIRRIIEGENVLFCASDVAKALGYKDAINATKIHCVGVVKRHLTISSGRKVEVNLIPESDVYRLICHSKLPSAMEFEKWVFEDVVPKAVRKTKGIEEPKIPQAEQLTLETSEYHYFKKYFNGQPVITIADFSHFTGVSRDAIRRFLTKTCDNGFDYYLLCGEPLAQFKRQNPSMNSVIPELYAITKSGAEKLVQYYECWDKVRNLFAEKKRSDEPKTNADECVVALSVLGFIRDELKKCENTEAVSALDVAIKQTAWELSQRIIS